MGFISDLKEKVLSYVDVYIKLLKVNVIGRTANVMSYFIFAIICLLVLFCIVLFAGFGLTEGLIAIGLSRFLSFLVTLVVFILMLIILMMSRKKITRKLGNTFVSILTEDDVENDDQ